MQDLYPFYKSVHDLTMEDLQKLVDDKVKPGYYIEYNYISYRNQEERLSKIDRIGRTIAAFANTDGGWYILGVQSDQNGIKNIDGHIDGRELSDLKLVFKEICDLIEKEIDSNLKDQIYSFHKFLTLQNNEEAKNAFLVIYIPHSSGELLPFKKDNNRIYRRFEETLSDFFPDIGDQPFYHYQSFDELKKHELESQPYKFYQGFDFIPIKDIWRLREFDQFRKFDIEKFDSLRKEIKPGNKENPIKVYNIDGFLVLVDGFYRVAASIEANVEEIYALVKEGKVEEALKESCKVKDRDRNLAIGTYLRAIGFSNGKFPKGYSQTIVAKELGSWPGSRIEQKVVSNYIKSLETKNIHKNNQLPQVKTKEVFSLFDITQTFGFEKEELDRWIRTIERKKQVIIYGPPGTGKTFLAKELAKHLTKSGDEGKDDRWDIVQFHPSYSYEDFIQGIRPEIDNNNSQNETNKDDQLTRQANGLIKYKWEKGRFLKFCEPAKDEKNKTKTYVLIIDEINRANLSSVFGELMYLLEYRNEKEKIKLAGNGREFGIPENVVIIGTMNTADRSVSPIDNALRRRFAFLHLPPKLEILDSHYKGTNFPIKELKEALEDVNKKITDENFQLGVSFFLKMSDQESYIKQIEDIWEMEIEPYLKANSFIFNESIENFKWKEIKKKFDEPKTND
jgi:MoxR-like ATPase